VADALHETGGQDLEGYHETLAHHELAAGRPESALASLETAWRQAEATSAKETASWYRQQLEEVRGELAEQESNSSRSSSESESESGVEVQKTSE
jgi:uncharacterized protein YciW